MSKIDIKHMVETDKTFRLNKPNMIHTIQEIVETVNGRPTLPFILFVDANDAPSNRYVSFKIKDLEIAPVDCIPIDFSVLYNGGSFESMLKREIELKRETYNAPYIPYIVQIPSDSERYKLFTKYEIESKICKYMEDTSLDLLKSGEYGNDEEESIKRKLAVTEIDALSYKLSIDNMKVSVNRLIASGGSDECTLGSILERSIMPATPKGILMLILHLLESRKFNIKRYRKNFYGLKIAVVGCNSKTTGVHLSNMLPKLKATVTMYHSASILSKDEFKDYDIVISCVGVPGLITKEILGDSAFGRILIDVGVSVVDGKVKGDFTEDTRTSILNHYTPYVNGVGLLTRSALMSNLVSAYSYLYGYNKIN